MKLTYEVTIRSNKTGKPLKTKRRFDAESEAAAREIAEAAGLSIVEMVVVDCWHGLVPVTGVSFKSRDNTSRYKVIRDCRAGDRIILEHESGNRHDQNAVRVLDRKRRQMGFLPRDVAGSLMKWFSPGVSPRYSAIVRHVEQWDGGGRPFIDLVVAAPTTTAQKVASVLEAGGVSKPAKHLPREMLESKPKTEFARRKTASSGCSLVLVLAVVGSAVCVMWLI